MQPRAGKLYVIGLGPGDPSHMTAAARVALAESQVVVGYRAYINLVRQLLEGKEVLASGMRQEVARARMAVEAAARGRVVAVISSGDPGIYGMAGLIYELLREKGWHREDGIEVEVVPGVPALSAAAALLGAPLMHDFAAISLSDLLTPWEVIARRLEMATRADFVIVLYNPKSTRRVEQLADAQAILCRHRALQTPVGIVRNAYREGQRVVVTDLQHLPDHEVDMFTTVVVGNSTTFAFEGTMVTPRGYAARYDLASANESVSPAGPCGDNEVRPLSDKSDSSSPAYYPLCLNLAGKRCVVVGGGDVAQRKVASLLGSGARVTLISPDLTTGLQRLRDGGRIDHLPRPYHADDLVGAVLAIAASDDPETNRAVAVEARRERVLANIVDDLVHCDFILPSVVSRDELLVAVSTGGLSPAFARYLRRELEDLLSPDRLSLLKLAAQARAELEAGGEGTSKEAWQGGLHEASRALAAGDGLTVARARLLARLRNEETRAAGGQAPGE